MSFPSTTTDVARGARWSHEDRGVFSAVDLLAAEQDVDRIVFRRCTQSVQLPNLVKLVWSMGLDYLETEAVLVPIHHREVWSKLDSGGKVELSVPASVAYATLRGRVWTVGANVR
jgi:hypothetical protein